MSPGSSELLFEVRQRERRGVERRGEKAAEGRGERRREGAAGHEQGVGEGWRSVEEEERKRSN